MVTIREDDLVDDVRDMTLIKYANALGRNFDSPDITLRILARPEGQRSHAERLLAPDEDMCRTLDSFYPGGQRADEALIIDVHTRRTPRPSPRQPGEDGNGYFPLMSPVIPPSASNSNGSGMIDPRMAHLPSLHADPARSMSILNTGHLAQLPSPGGVRRHREHRPKNVRQHTSSPTIITHSSNAGVVPLHMPSLAAPQHLPIRSRPRLSSTASDKHPNLTSIAPPLPTPPIPEAVPTAKPGSTPTTPGIRDQPTARTTRPRRSRKATPTNANPTVKSPSGLNKSTFTSSLLDNSVPPINVLIVEDNIINLKLLEAFMKRLKVRWSTAMNGQIAVDKWRAGGFHLVLMDIQLPIMSGLEATKEIRRLERVNGIGVFSNSAPTTPAGIGKRSDPAIENGSTDVAQNANNDDGKTDKLNVDDGLFKSPVIIVALTASSLQSDRHEALAAGCNDFLTKVRSHY